jgi:hypothetical protein
MANKKINDLVAIDSVIGSTQFETDTNGTTSNKATASQIKTFVENGIVISNSTGDLAQSRITNLVSDLAAKASLTGSETLTNKTINLTSNTLTGTIAQFNAALSDSNFATLTGVGTLTNKTVNLTSNTLTGTKAQFDTAVSDGNILFVGDITQYTDEQAQDAVGEILTDTTSIDAIYDDAGNTISFQREALTGAITASKNSNATSLGSFTTSQLNTALSDNDVATLAGTETLTNKTLTNPAIANISGNVAVAGTLSASNLSGTNTGNQNIFSTIAVSGQSDVVADTTSDTLTLVAGSGMLITTNAGTDTITLATTGGGGGGEVNTASNVNVGGVGVFKQKTGVDLEFRGVNAGSNKVSVALDAGNNEIDLDLGVINEVISISANYSIVDADNNKLFLITTQTSDIVITLPNPATAVLGTRVSFLKVDNTLGIVKFTKTPTVFWELSIKNDFLEVVNTGVDWAIVTFGNYFLDKSVKHYFHDYTSTIGFEVGGSLINLFAGSGAGFTGVAATAGLAGIGILSTGTTLSGYSAAILATTSAQSPFIQNGNFIGHFKVSVSVVTLSDVAQTFDAYVGFIPALVSSAPTNGVYFQYDTDQSANWLCVTANNGVRTTVNSGVAVTLDYNKLEVRFNNSEARYYINNTFITSISTNLPTGAFSFGKAIFKSVGTTARTLRMDWLAADINLGNLNRGI